MPPLPPSSTATHTTTPSPTFNHRAVIETSSNNLKPILKHPLKPSPNHKNPLKPALTPTPPPKYRQGDPTWLRVMHTKENQWRLINTIALHQLNLLERESCAQLDSLAEQLDSLITQTAHLDALVRRCRQVRARQKFLTVASDPIRNVVQLLLRLPHTQVTDALVESTAALELHAPAIGEEVSRFCDAAKRFKKAAEVEGLYDLVDVAALLEQVASLAKKEPDAVSCAAQAVVDAGNATENARLDIVDKLVDVSNTTFVAEPSFIE